MPEEWQVPATMGHAIDVVGILYRNDTFEPLEGFHVNLRLPEGVDLPQELAVFVLPTPQMPKRVFA
jgi:hypothetical protein